MPEQGDTHSSTNWGNCPPVFEPDSVLGMWHQEDPNDQNFWISDPLRGSQRSRSTFGVGGEEKKGEKRETDSDYEYIQVYVHACV